MKLFHLQKYRESISGHRFFGNGYDRIHIYYSSNVDGQGAAVLVSGLHVNIPDGDEMDLNQITQGTNVILHGCNIVDAIDFSDALNDAEEGHNTLVYLLGITKRDQCTGYQMMQLYRTKNIHIIWIDYHRTSLEILHTYPKLNNVSGILRTSDNCHAATSLTWMYIQSKLHCFISGEEDPSRGLHTILTDSQLEAYEWKAPSWVQAINKHYHQNMMSGFYSGCKLNAFFHEYKQSDDAPLYLLSFLDHYCNIMSMSKSYWSNQVGMDREILEESTVNCITRRGLMGDHFAERMIRKQIEKHSFDCLFHLRCTADYIDPKGVLNVQIKEGLVNCIGQVLCCNVDSDVGKCLLSQEAFDNHDIVALYYFDGVYYHYRLYSNTEGFECDIIASYFSRYFGTPMEGNEHMASFITPSPIFKKETYHLASNDGYCDIKGTKHSKLYIHPGVDVAECPTMDLTFETLATLMEDEKVPDFDQLVGEDPLDEDDEEDKEDSYS